MSKLDELLEGFRSDKGWNTENRDGSHRFDKEIEWIGQMINEYAEYFKMPVDEVVEIMEKKGHIHGQIIIKKRISRMYQVLEN